MEREWSESEGGAVRQHWDYAHQVLALDVYALRVFARPVTTEELFFLLLLLGLLLPLLLLLLLLL